MTLAEFIREISLAVIYFHDAMQKTGASGMRLEEDKWLELFLTWWEDRN